MTEPKLLTDDELSECLDAIKGGYDYTSGLLESHIAALTGEIDRLKNGSAATLALVDVCREVVQGHFAEWGISDADLFRGRPLRIVLNEACERMAEELAARLMDERKAVPQ